MKIDQIAFGCSTKEIWEARAANVIDKVTFSGIMLSHNIHINGGEAWLAFDYSNKIEMEYLYYVDRQNSFHNLINDQDDIFLSHLGSHVNNIDYYLRCHDVSKTIVMDVTTTQHSNPELIENGRKYRYVIMDWRKTHGYFYKLIQRIEKPGSDTN